MKRLRELDFLRGIAVLLVFIRHQPLNTFTSNLGWIGVDLFFVLSGFLVSGLLFKEYIKFGDIKPVRFLIRRGFKIYPIFYLSYPLYLFFLDRVSYRGVLSDLTFTQNYFYAWGYANGVSWTLAIEEQFYFGLALFLYIGLNSRFFILRETTKKFTCSLLLVFIGCLIARCVSLFLDPTKGTQIFTMTHFRIDSLSAGVLISYLYYFRPDYLKIKFQYFKKPLVVLCVIGLAWPPLYNINPFAITLGFTLLYISFGIILTYFILTDDINEKLDYWFSPTIVNFISKVGLSSYSLYLIHVPVIMGMNHIIKEFGLYNNLYINFIITLAISLFIGHMMTGKIEYFFLNIRDKWFPPRTAELTFKRLQLKKPAIEEQAIF